MDVRPLPALDGTGERLGAAASHAMLPADEVIEVPAEEMDLASLAELAKKVVERKP